MAKRHIIPHSYLSGFLSPNLEPNKTPFLCVYDGETKKWGRRFLGNLTTRPDYYDLTERDGSKNPILEEFLSKVEGAVAGVIKDALEKRQPLTSQQRDAVAMFVATLLVRVPEVHESIANSMNSAKTKAVQMTIQQAKQDPSSWEQLKRVVLEVDPEFDFSSLAPKDLSPSEVELTVDEDTPKRIVFQALETPYKLLMSMGWSFWCTDSNAPFVTSNSPVTAMNPQDPHSPYSGGLALEGTEVTCPLSSSILFHASWRDTDKLQYFGAKEEVVAQLNQRTAVGSSQLFTGEQQFPGAAELTGRS